MSSSLKFCVTYFSAWLFIAASGWAADPGQWNAGAAKVSITPTEPVWMAGYASRSGPSEGAIVDLYARALALSDANMNRLLIVTMDLIEIPDSLREAILNVAQVKHGIKPNELLLNVSHTHGGPMVSAKNVADWGIDPVWGDRAENYVKNLVHNVDVVIEKALSGQAPANVSYGQTRCGFAMNRRLPTSDGIRLAPNPDGPVDHDVPVLSVKSQDGKLIGLVFGYACHNTALSDTRMINGDYAGFAQKKLEADHPDSVALFLMGCGGDQDPSPRRDQYDAEQNGLSLASAAESVLSSAPAPLKASLTTSLKMCPLTFSPLPSRADLESRAQSPNGFVSRHASWILKEWPNPGNQPSDYQLPVQVVVLGETVTLVAIGGEPVVDYSIRLKKELARDGCSVWIAGYSNLVNAYIPSRRVLLEGGYEGTEAIIYQSLPSPFTTEIEDRIVETVQAQARAAWGESKTR